MGSKRTRLVVSDIDGCLTHGISKSYSLELLRRLAEINAESRSDPAVPAITYCTGRPQPYVECLMQATGAYMPALCEGGSVFFDPSIHSVAFHSSFGVREQALLTELRSMIQHEMISDQVMFEPGEVTHVTLLLTPPLQPEDRLEQACAIAARFGDEFTVETTRICIHILFRHLHKGTGIEWLASHTGIDPEEMAGIGDAAPDIPFLRMMGMACAPANAHDDVKKVCGFVSRLDGSAAVLEFLDHVIERNKKTAD
jgi:hydroxymethylpyrimidine pyrophosphatase-like HAD family hydrolase